MREERRALSIGWPTPEDAFNPKTEFQIESVGDDSRTIEASRHSAPVKYNPAKEKYNLTSQYVGHSAPERSLQHRVAESFALVVPQKFAPARGGEALCPVEGVDGYRS